MDIDDDPLMVSIRQQADVIGWTCSGTRSFEPQAWSKAQLLAMLDQVREAAENILVLSGVAASGDRVVDVWSDLSARGVLTDFQRYTDLEG